MPVTVSLSGLFCFGDTGVAGGKGEAVSCKDVFGVWERGAGEIRWGGVLSGFSRRGVFAGDWDFCFFSQLSIVVLLMPVSWAQRVVLLPASVASRRSTSCFFSSEYAMLFLFSVKLSGLRRRGVAMFVSFLRCCVVVSRER